MNRFCLSVVLCSGVLLASGCVPRLRYNASQADLAAAQKQLAAANEQVSDLQKQLEAAKAQLAEVREQLIAAKTVPVRLVFQRTAPGASNAATLTSVFKRELALTLAITSRTSGATKTYQIYLPAQGHRDLGHAQGMPFDDGDEIRITNPDYDPLVTTFHPVP